MQRPRTNRRAVAKQARPAKRLSRFPALPILAAAVLVFAACSTSSQVEVAAESPPVDESQEIAATEAAGVRKTPTDESGAGIDTASPDTGDTAVATDAVNVQVLVVSVAIDEGTSVNELLEAPVLWLSPRALPSDVVDALAISNIAELTELAGMVAARTILPGEQLDRLSFEDPEIITGADGCASNKVVDTNFDVTAENVQVMVLREDIPAGFPVSAFFEEPDFYLAVQRVGADQLCASAISQMITLNAIVDQQALTDMPAGAALHESAFG